MERRQMAKYSWGLGKLGTFEEVGRRKLFYFPPKRKHIKIQQPYP